MANNKQQRYKVILGGGTHRPGRPKTGPGSDDMNRLTIGEVISDEEYSPQSIASLLDNKMIAPYDGDEPTSPQVLDKTVFSPVVDLLATKPAVAKALGA